MKPNRIVTIVLLMILLVSTVAAGAFTIEIQRPNSGWQPIASHSPNILCTNAGTFSVDTRYGSRQHCLDACAESVATAEGQWLWRANKAPFTCSGPQSPTSVPGTGVSGAQTLIFCSVGGSGSCPVASQTPYCDCTPPSTPTITTNTNWYRGGFTTPVQIQDNLGLRSLQRYQRTSPTASWNLIGTQACSGTTCTHNVPVLVDGTYCTQTGQSRCDLRAVAVDLWDRTRDSTASFNIDRIAPTGTHSFTRSPEYPSSGTSPLGRIWYQDDVTVRVQSNDRVTTSDQSGVKLTGIAALSTSGSSCPEYGSSYTSYPNSGGGLDATAERTTTSSSNVRARFCYYAEDNAITGTSTIGNRQPRVSTPDNVWIDGAPPTVVITPNNPGAIPGALSDGWTQRNDFTITITCNDPGGSGCDEIDYDWNIRSDDLSCSYSTQNVPGTDAATSQSITQTGTLCDDNDDCVFNVCARARDNVGHQSAAITYTYRIDRLPPQITNFEPVVVNDRHANWYNRNFPMRATIRDDHGGGGSGFGGDSSTCHIRRQGTTTPIATMPCSGQGGTYETTVTVGPGGICPNQGSCMLELVARDRVGNEATATYEVFIDTVEPNLATTVETIHTGDECNYLNTTTGVIYYGAGINSGACGTSAFDVRADVTDNAPSAGIWGIQWGSEGSNVIPNAPVITTSGSTASSWSHTKTYTTSPSGSGNYEDITIAVEDRSYPGPWGSGNVRDPAGDFTVNFDSQPPTSTLSPSQNVWVGDSFTFSITATDDKVPVRRFWYNFESDATNVAPEECSGDRSGLSPIGTSVSGSFDCAPGDVCMARLCWAAEDEVSNIEDVQGHLYGVDRSPPTVHPFLYRPSPRYPFEEENVLSDAVDTWFNETFEIEVRITDIASGVDSCEYRIDSNSDDDWYTAGCTPADINLEGPGVDDDREQFVTLTIPVGSSANGPAGACNTQGRDSCRIDVRAFDGVGNPSEIRSEIVSIDWTPPSCELIMFEEGEDPLNQYFNAVTGVFYYNPIDPQTDPDGNYTLHMRFTDENGLSGDAVSGIYRTVFPPLTGSPDPDGYEEPLDMSPSLSGATNHPVYERSLEYTYDESSTYSSLDSGPAQVIVQDQAGNIGTCEVEVVRDTEPPELDNQIVRFDHVNLELSFYDEYEPNLFLHLSATDHAADPDDEEGAGIRNAELRLTNTSGIQSGSSGYYPTCDPFLYDGLNPLEDPLIATSPEGWDEGIHDMSPTEEATFRATLEAGEGRCFQVYGVFYDRVNNFVIVPPHQGEGANENKVIAVDGSPMDGGPLDYENACSFFGVGQNAFDNCNNRSAHLNGLPVDQFLTTSCPGSCHRGTVIIPDRSAAGSRVQLAGFAVDEITPPEYEFVVGSSSPYYYRIYNITEGPNEGSPAGRMYTLVATPPSDLQSMFNPRSREVFIQQFEGDPASRSYPPVLPTQLTIGFRESLCTPSCTLTSDPIPGTCNIDCAGINGCPGAGDDGYDALVACQGISSGFVTTDDGNIYQCCTSRIDDISEIGALSATFEVEGARNVARNERLVMLGGRLVKLVVITFD